MITGSEFLVLKTNLVCHEHNMQAHRQRSMDHHMRHPPHFFLAVQNYTQTMHGARNMLLVLDKCQETLTGLVWRLIPKNGI